MPGLSSASRTHVVLALTTIYLVWGSTYLAIRVAVETIPPFAMAAGRFLIAGLILAAYLKIRGAPRSTPRQWIDNTAIGTLLLLGGNAAVGWAVQFIDSGVAALLIGVGPLFIVLTEWAWPGGRRPAALTFAALLVGLGGVAWLAAPWDRHSPGGLHLPAVLAVLAACVFWAVGSIYSRNAKSGAGPIVAAAQQMIGGGASLVVASYFFGDFHRLSLSAISTPSWIAFAYLVLIGSLVGFSTFVWLMKNVAPALAATYAYVNPLVAVFLGWWLLNEPVSSRTFVSSALIITSVVIITLKRNHRVLAVPPRQAVSFAGATGPGTPAKV